MHQCWKFGDDTINKLTFQDVALTARMHNAAGRTTSAHYDKLLQLQLF